MFKPSRKKSSYNTAGGSSLLALLKPYLGLISILILLAFFSNGLELLLPKLIATAIDSFRLSHFVINTIFVKFFAIAVSILVTLYVQSIAQTYVAEKVARGDTRTRTTGGQE